MLFFAPSAANGESGEEKERERNQSQIESRTRINASTVADLVDLGKINKFLYW